MDASLYSRPNKPKVIPVKRRERDFSLSSLESPELLSVDRSTECHVTPAPEAKKMAEYLNIETGLHILEPQCGTGNLIAAVLEDALGPVNITGIERHVSLYNSVKKRFPKGVNLINECFLEYAKTTSDRFDRIVTNPPFRHTKKHFEAAIKLLKYGGSMIALVPVTFDYSGAYEIEQLERGIFPTANVSTKLIEFYK